MTAVQMPTCTRWYVRLANAVLCTLAATVFASAEPADKGPVTGLHLIDEDAKAVAVLEVSKVLTTPFGQRNLQNTMAGPQGQQFLAQVQMFNAKYGVNVMRDVYRLTVIAPFTDGEPFADVVFAIDAKLNKQAIEQSLAGIDRYPAERHGDCLIFEVAGDGNGKFFCSVLSDSLFVLSLDKQTVAKAIDRAAENTLGASKKIAEAINALPVTHMAWAVADSNAFARTERDWVLFRENSEWFSVGIGIVGPAATLDATFQAPNPVAAESLEDLLARYLKREDTSQQILGVLPPMIRPRADSLLLTREGTQLKVSATGL